MRWWGPMGLLAAIRVAIPLAAYADAGSGLPGMPAFTRPTQDGGLSGDATGFYAATREFMAAWGRMPRPVLALDALAALAAVAVLVLLWRRRPPWRPWLVPAALSSCGRGARAHAATDADALGSRRLRTERGDAREALERVARYGGARRRLPAGPA